MHAVHTAHRLLCVRSWPLRWLPKGFRAEAVVQSFKSCWPDAILFALRSSVADLRNVFTCTLKGVILGVKHASTTESLRSFCAIFVRAGARFARLGRCIHTFVVKRGSSLCFGLGQRLPFKLQRAPQLFSEACSHSIAEHRRPTVCAVFAQLFLYGHDSHGSVDVFTPLS